MIEEDEAQQIRRIYQWYADGLGVYSIVKRLNQHEPGRWKPGRVRYILSNERYRGVRIWNQRRFERRPGSRQKVMRMLPRSEWKSYSRPELRIIDDDLWDRVQARRQDVKQRVPPDGRMRGRNGALFSPHLFTGFMRCGECGGAITVVTGGYGSPRYGCQRAWKAGPSICSNRLTARARIVDAALLAVCRRPSSIRAWFLGWPKS